MQNFLLDTQEKFKYSNWFSLEPGEGEEGGRVAKAEFTQGQSIQRLDPRHERGRASGGQRQDLGQLVLLGATVLLQPSHSLLLRWPQPGRMAMRRHFGGSTP